MRHPEPNCGQPWQKVVANVGNAKSQGVEVQFDWAASEHLSLGANATWLDAKVTEDVEEIGVPDGARLPLSPEFKGALYAQYDWDVDWFGASNAWLRLQWSYTGNMLNQVEETTLETGLRRRSSSRPITLAISGLGSIIRSGACSFTSTTSPTNALCCSPTLTSLITSSDAHV